MTIDTKELMAQQRPHGLPFRIAKIGHVVINVSDLDRSVGFYTQVLGFSVSDVYPETMVPGGMVFLRCNHDHHALALVGILKQPSSERRDAIISHSRWRRSTRCCAPAIISAATRRNHRFRRQAPRRLPDRGRVPRSRRPSAGDLSGASTRSAATAMCGPPTEWKWAHSLDEAIADPCAARTPRCRTRRCSRRYSHHSAGVLQGDAHGRDRTLLHRPGARRERLGGRMRRLSIAIGSYGLTRALKDKSVASERLPLDFIEVSPITAAMRRMVRSLDLRHLRDGVHHLSLRQGAGQAHCRDSRSSSLATSTIGRPFTG